MLINIRPILNSLVQCEKIESNKWAFNNSLVISCPFPFFSSTHTRKPCCDFMAAHHYNEFCRRTPFACCSRPLTTTLRHGGHKLISPVWRWNAHIIGWTASELPSFTINMSGCPLYRYIPGGVAPPRFQVLNRNMEAHSDFMGSSGFTN